MQQRSSCMLGVGTERCAHRGRRGRTRGRATRPRAGSWPAPRCSAGGRRPGSRRSTAGCRPGCTGSSCPCCRPPPPLSPSPVAIHTAFRLLSYNATARLCCPCILFFEMHRGFISKLSLGETYTTMKMGPYAVSVTLKMPSRTKSSADLVIGCGCCTLCALLGRAHGKGAALALRAGHPVAARFAPVDLMPHAPHVQQVSSQHRQDLRLQQNNHASGLMYAGTPHYFLHSKYSTLANFL